MRSILFSTIALAVTLASVTGCSKKDESAPSPPTATIEEVLNLGNSEVSMAELRAQEYDYPEVGVAVGRGWSSYLGQPTQSRCVTGTEIPLQVNSNNVTYHDVFDREQLLSSMRVSAKASYGVASGRASFSRSVKIDKSVRTIVATVDVINNGVSLDPAAVGTDGLKQIALVPSALAILNNTTKSPEDRLDEFYRMCGDAYVEAIHNGARLNALFFLSLNEAETKQAFSASVSGSYGGASGSAQAKSAVQRNKTNNEMKIVQTHWGGPAGVADNPADMLARIDTFSKLGPEQAKPFSVWTTSYRRAANWPKEFLYSGLSARTVSLMAGQVWRLHELGELYADAATAPHRYYFPFTPGQRTEDFQKAAVERSDALFGASACIQNMAVFCASKTRCDMKDAFKAETIHKVCPALKDASEGFRQTVSSVLIGSRPRTVLKDLNESLTRDIAAAAKVHTTQAAPASAPSIQPQETNEQKSVLGLTPGEVYYRLLAEAPIPRNWTGNTHDTRNALDSTKQLEWYCAIEQLECADVVYDKLAGDAVAPAGAKSVLRTWIVRTKLLPLSKGFCNELGHPMCLSQAQLSALTAQLEPQFGKARNFVLSPPPPPPPAPQPRVIEPPQRMWPCPGRPGNTNCI
jgi:hypothetical protein